MEEIRMRAICMECGKLVDYEIFDEDDICEVKGENIEYKRKVARCKECHKEVWVGELDDKNAELAIEAYCKKNGLITITEIKQILKKYDIGRRPLSKLLGWGEITLTRFLQGQIPTKIYSDKLKELFDEKKFSKLLEEGKDKIGNTTYLKCKKKLNFGEYVPILSMGIYPKFNFQNDYYKCNKHNDFGGKKWNKILCVC